MNPQPLSMKVIAVINFIFGGIGILISLFGLFFSTAMVRENSSPDVSLALWSQASAFVHMLIGAFAVISGIGLIKAKAWGWPWTLAYAITAIAITWTLDLVLGMAVRNALNVNVGGIYSPFVGSVTKTVYPLILIIFLNRTSWKDAFTSSNPQV